MKAAMLGPVLSVSDSATRRGSSTKTRIGMGNFPVRVKVLDFEGHRGSVPQEKTLLLAN